MANEFILAGVRIQEMIEEGDSFVSRLIMVKTSITKY
jgi:hypothetical protein